MIYDAAAGLLAFPLPHDAGRFPPNLSHEHYHDNIEMMEEEMKEFEEKKEGGRRRFHPKLKAASEDNLRNKNMGSRREGEEE